MHDRCFPANHLLEYAFHAFHMHHQCHIPPRHSILLIPRGGHHMKGPEFAHPTRMTTPFQSSDMRHEVALHVKGHVFDQPSRVRPLFMRNLWHQLHIHIHTLSWPLSGLSWASLGLLLGFSWASLGLSWASLGFSWPLSIYFAKKQFWYQTFFKLFLFSNSFPNIFTNCFSNKSRQDPRLINSLSN